MSHVDNFSKNVIRLFSRSFQVVAKSKVDLNALTRAILSTKRKFNCGKWRESLMTIAF